MKNKFRLTLLFTLIFATLCLASAQTTPSFNDLCTSKDHSSKALTYTFAILKKQSGMTDCTSLEQWLTTQTDLDLSNDILQDLRPFAFAKNLQRLYLWGEEIVDIQPLSALIHLKELELGGNQIKDLTPLKNLKQLQQLGIRTNTYHDLSPISGLTQLQSLDIRNMNTKLKNLSALSNLTQLTELLMGNNTRRKGVDLSVQTDLRPISGLTQLQFLDISNINIKNVSVLSNLTKLNTLYIENGLSKNRITYFDFLAKLQQLTFLSMGFNGVTDIRSIPFPLSLTYLGLEGNPIPTKQIEDFAKKRPNLRIAR